MTTTRVLRGVGGIVMVAALVAIQAGAAGGQTGQAVRLTGKTAAPATCQRKELGIALTVAQGGLSHQGYVIEFKNRGAACMITGYPGVDALNAAGHRVLSATRTKSGYLGGVESGPIPRVNLARGKTASAMLEWIDLGSPPCARAKSFRITPPNAIASVVLSPKSLRVQSLCRVEVHPVVPGTTGQRP
ncbi:MAG: DUF4232 domain-containing protein [Solirubrobacteraceae bacterium]